MDGTAVGCVVTAIVALVAAGGGVAEAAEAAAAAEVGAADADRCLTTQRNRAPGLASTQRAPFPFPS
jgi:hypothetical protein